MFSEKYNTVFEGFKIDLLKTTTKKTTTHNQTKMKQNPIISTLCDKHLKNTKR